jgi:hypothetical protein
MTRGDRLSPTNSPPANSKIPQPAQFFVEPRLEMLMYSLSTLRFHAGEPSLSTPVRLFRAIIPAARDSGPLLP